MAFPSILLSSPCVPAAIMAGYRGRWTLLLVLFVFVWTESAAQNNQPRVGSGVEIAELPEDSPPGEREDTGGGRSGGRAPSSERARTDQ